MPLNNSNECHYIDKYYTIEQKCDKALRANKPLNPQVKFQGDLLIRDGNVNIMIVVFAEKVEITFIRITYLLLILNYLKQLPYH